MFISFTYNIMLENIATLDYRIYGHVVFSTRKWQIKCKGRILAAFYFLCSRHHNSMKHFKRASRLENVTQFDCICWYWFSIISSVKTKVWLVSTEQDEFFLMPAWIKADPLSSTHRNLPRKQLPAHSILQPCPFLARRLAQKYTKLLNNVDDHTTVPELKPWIVSLTNIDLATAHITDSRLGCSWYPMEVEAYR